MNNIKESIFQASRVVRNLVLIIEDSLRYILLKVSLGIARYYQGKPEKGKVLHISYMVHVPYYMTRELRRYGIHADFLALGKSKTWNKCDFNVRRDMPVIRVLYEMIVLWSVLVKYEVFHLHFGHTISPNGWEFRILKCIGRRIIVQYRGCDIRTRRKNYLVNPKVNICEDCDYSFACEKTTVETKRKASLELGDYFLVTTPDLRDFIPGAEQMPFLTYPNSVFEKSSGCSIRNKNAIKIVHVTNHPGIEGTKHILNSIARINGRDGKNINFVFLKGVPNSVYIKELENADLSIGKMKMGYYANAQIESLMMGVPAITWVRAELLTKEIRESGLIICSLNNLEETLRFYINHPEELREKRKIAKESVLKLHNNSEICGRLKEIYQIDDSRA